MAGPDTGGPKQPQRSVPGTSAAVESARPGTVGRTRDSDSRRPPVRTPPWSCRGRFAGRPAHLDRLPAEPRSRPAVHRRRAATPIPTPTPTPQEYLLVTTTTEPTTTTTQLNGLLKADLHQLASALGIQGTARLRKGELVEAITSTRSTIRPPAPAEVPRPAGTEGGGGRPAQRARARSDGPAQPDTTAASDLLPVAGVLDIREGNAVLRTSGYLPGPTDVNLPAGQVRALGLRTGDVLTGATRPRAGGARPSMADVDTVNGNPAEESRPRPAFHELTPLYPHRQLRLETESDPRQLTGRVIDLVAPIGKGQRGLIVAPPKAGKTLVLQSIAEAIARNHPEAHLMVVLVDERPEEVTDMRRSVKGEVIASTFDRPAREHIALAELAVERAKRLVELGHDVVVLLDSLTRLARAHNATAPANGRTLSGGLDASVLQHPKRLFGAARSIENGGSLTILATALVDTGSRMDDLIFEEFKSTGNMELRLDRRLADRRVFPAVDVKASGTRREELLLGPARTPATWALRRALGGLDTQQATELLLDRVKRTRGNAELLRQVVTNSPSRQA
ncbi:transcription termination factor Rho [Kitasatospora purpeofusca]|uniref:transcription termination factor Rho n=1 Tax=Kitasatospora purpeofusca TaxID=67352 RepID=UPI002A5AE034|nr:transcription termination factor Rho [Kitasatospora purpeofusca]MDY0813046.1 transcription termination factor Rho [Kitasatospora purpeofusca]